MLDIRIAEKISELELTHLFNRRIKDLQFQDKTFYIGYEEDEITIRGYAFPVGGPGFWGPIYGMAGVDPEATKILGLAFYKHSETPGLGGRISEDWFVDQFKGLPIYTIEGNKNIFFLTPSGNKSSPNQLDAITGATNTSSAVEKFLNQNLDNFLANLWREIFRISHQKSTPTANSSETTALYSRSFLNTPASIAMLSLRELQAQALHPYPASPQRLHCFATIFGENCGKEEK